MIVRPQNKSGSQRLQNATWMALSATKGINRSNTPRFGRVRNGRLRSAYGFGICSRAVPGCGRIHWFAVAHLQNLPPQTETTDTATSLVLGAVRNSNALSI